MWTGRWNTSMPVRMRICRNGLRITPVTTSRPYLITAAAGWDGMFSPDIAMWMPRLLTWKLGLLIAMCRRMWSALSARKGEAWFLSIRLQHPFPIWIGASAISLQSALIQRAPCPCLWATSPHSLRRAQNLGTRRPEDVGWAGSFHWPGRIWRTFARP